MTTMTLEETFNADLKEHFLALLSASISETELKHHIRMTENRSKGSRFSWRTLKGFKVCVEGRIYGSGVKAVHYQLNDKADSEKVVQKVVERLKVVHAIETAETKRKVNREMAEDAIREKLSKTFAMPIVQDGGYKLTLRGDDIQKLLALLENV